MSAGLVGREPELAALRTFVDSQDFPRTLVLTGEPGMGKTAIWATAIDWVSSEGWRVMTTRASHGETMLDFAGLIDLFEGVDLGELAIVPGPQRAALEVALLRDAGDEDTAAPQAVGMGFLNTLRSLSADRPVLVAVDDLQWLDEPSAEAMSFAVRRLQQERVAFVFTRRPGAVTKTLGGVMRPLGRTTPPTGAASSDRAPEELLVAGLQPADLGHLLAGQIGVALNRQLLQKVARLTLGNPLYAIELARTIRQRGQLDPGADIPLPTSVDNMLADRIADVSPEARRVLLAVALSGELTIDELEAVGIPASIDEALAAGLVVVDGGKARAGHPLLAAAIRARATITERRELHRVLAQSTPSAELRSLHLALSTDTPNEELASTISAAASSAARRGAGRNAIDLAEHAVRLTPTASEARPDRLLQLGGYLEDAGALQRVADLLMPEIESLPPGSKRARGWLLLSESSAVTTYEEQLLFHDRALQHGGDDPAIVSDVLAIKAFVHCIGAAQNIAGALDMATRAAEAAGRARADVRLPMCAVGWSRILAGESIDDMLASTPPVRDSFPVMLWLDRAAAQQRAWRGDVGGARAEFQRLQSLSDERGEAESFSVIGLHALELELRAGEFVRADRILATWAATGEPDLIGRDRLVARCRAVLAAARGDASAAAELATDALTITRKEGILWDELEILRALGVLALFEGKPADGVDGLRDVWSHLEREGVNDRGAFPVAPELVETLVQIEELAEAAEVTRRLGELAQQQDHPWGLATAMRCDATIRLAGKAYDEDAAARLEEAAEAFDRLGMRFDSSRSRLLLGSVQRRFNKRAAARSSLGSAAESFERAGASGWAERARSELARVSGQRPSSTGGLTPAEAQVAELASRGLANKEIAAQLSISVYTVERHLTHAFAKLGVRSRGHLRDSLDA